MTVHLNNTAVSNGLDVRITLMNGGVILATLDPRGSASISGAFDRIGLYNPPHPPVFRTQAPPAVVVLNPGNIGILESSPPNVTFKYAPPHGQSQVVTFT